jgi:hypothetical protein
LSPSKNDKEKPPQQRNFALLRVKDMLVHFTGYESFSLDPSERRKKWATSEHAN